MITGEEDERGFDLRYDDDWSKQFREILAVIAYQERNHQKQLDKWIDAREMVMSCSEGDADEDLCSEAEYLILDLIADGILKPRIIFDSGTGLADTIFFSK